MAAAALRARGLHRGDRFAIMAGNHPEFVEELIAASITATVEVPITLNGVAWTFVTGSPGATQTQIQGSLAATLTQMATDLNGSANGESA